MNTRNKSITMTAFVTLAVVVLIISSAQAQTLTNKQTDKLLSDRAEFRLDLFRMPARSRNLLLRPAGFSLMRAVSTGIITSAMTVGAAASLQVLGSGTVGKLTKWTGITSGNSFIGDSNIFEDKFGKVGIGTTTPTSILTVQGMIEITVGGLKFPDGTVQTTSAAEALFSVAHDATLKGNGTAAMQLGVAVPLNLSGAVSGALSESAVIRAINTALSGNGMFAQGGNPKPGFSFDRGGIGMLAQGGNSVITGGAAGIGVVAIGGTAIIPEGPSKDGGEAVFARGGGSVVGLAGPGVRATGGESNTGIPGDGIEAVGGTSSGGGSGSAGVRATGGKSLGNTFGGPGVLTTGGESISGTGGPGLLATGGESSTGQGGGGVGAFGGPANGIGNSGGVGIRARGGSGTNGATDGFAGLFDGDVIITGNLSKGGGSFKIDHPLDPENKYLYHSFVESPDMKNIYDGVIRLDGNGEVIVAMPEWFSTLNRDFRYLLTPIGAPMPGLYISEELKDNRFRVAGGQPGMKVSWQVTGIRQDAYANKNRIKVEEQKTERERGFYLHPEAFNQPQERGVEWARDPELMQRIKEAREKAQKAKQN
jgi:hypothetical protein